MNLFSIIVPVYNVEDYIEECIESIVSQTFKDIEVILVDDGSTDNSSKICDDYIAKYDFIKVIHKENGGLSSSRNAGIKNATGKYLLFIDSDDKLANNKVLEIISNNLNGKDVLLLGFEKWYFDNTTSIIVKDVTLIGENIDEIIFNLVKNNNFVSSACNKCINRTFFITNDLFFKEGILSEDVEWSVRLLKFMTSIDSIKGSYYMYRQSRKGSISTVFSRKHAYDLTDSIEECIEYANEINGIKKEAILNYVAYQYIILMAYYPEFKDINIKNRVNKLSFLLKYNLMRKVKIINLFKKIFGFKLSTILMNRYVRNRK